ncbi:aldehyde dehydrogenase family protein [Brevibacillus nitrificans]|uniref:aldehyde dehydrogenase family protein n=1 Tax=Brevibacillus nitrificans TaxID=651560 RepID=UPI00262152AD|nr:aldehyde dehydrogenase family protein [Brevibacillus nitrificans]
MSTYRVELFINQEDVATDKYAEVRDPGKLTEVVGTVAQGNAELVDKAVRAAHQAYLSWRNVSLQERAALLLKAADLLEQEAPVLAPLLTRESGMILSNYRMEIPAAAEAIRTTVELAEAFFEPEQMRDAQTFVSVEKRPLGVIAALTPWNVPMTITMNKLAPILVTGNTIVIKPSPFSCLAVTIALKKMAALFPPGVINIVHGEADVGVALTTHPLVRKITLTGGGKTATAVMKSAAESLKRVHFELGGNDPAILLDDVNLEKVIPQIAQGSFVRSGQVCVATKRVYIPKKLYQDASDLFVKTVDAFKIGHGLNEQATFGPVNNRGQYQFVKDLIARAKESKATVLELGTKLEPENWENGYYLHPTVVLHADPQQEIVVTEQFGPIIPLVAYDTEEEVIQLANDTEYGLGSSVWTSDEERGLRVARQVEAGMTGINGRVHSSLGQKYVPFGGIKQSGMGWEKASAGLMEFVNFHGITLHSR